MFQHIANFFQSHYCDESQQAFKPHDLALVIESTVVPYKYGLLGIPDFVDLTGSIEIKLN